MPTVTLAEQVIVPPDESIIAAVQQRLDGKTKPIGSLGRLESIACQIAAIQNTHAPIIREKAIVVMAGDHGVAAEGGISAFPQAVTGQMLLNFAAGGAAINVLARHANAHVEIVDMGTVGTPPPSDMIRSERVAEGTANFLRGAAMSREEALCAVETGIRIAHELADRQVDIIGLGEMGIGNTTASSALAAAYLQCPAADVIGRGTGVDDAGLIRKREAVEQAIRVNAPDVSDALDVLRKLGGFEIAGLAGVVIGAAARRVAVIVDGFITSAAALAAVRLMPGAATYLLPSHCSVEVGHIRILNELKLTPLFDLQMRLGEGSGAAVAMPMIEAAIKILAEMATFDEAGVSESE